MNDEELTDLQEELTVAQAELERLQVTTADREAHAAHVAAQLSELREELTHARDESRLREQEIATLGEQAQALQAQVQSSAQRYRELALQQSPELPAELVTGESVEEVDEALQRARETVSKVRGHLESQAQAGRVPVGAPPRSEPDLSALPAAEKIRRGLQQKNG